MLSSYDDPRDLTVLARVRARKLMTLRTASRIVRWREVKGRFSNWRTLTSKKHDDGGRGSSGAGISVESAMSPSAGLF